MNRYFAGWLMPTLLLLALAACSKDDLKEPVQAAIYLEMATEGLPEDEDGLITVTGGQYTFSEFVFKGYRESGDDYHFTKDFPDSLKVRFTPNEVGNILNFQMPVGVYERIELALGIPATNAREQENAQSSSPGEWQRELPKGGVELWGNYKNTREAEVPFLFIYNSPDEFQFRAKQAGQDQVVVREGNRQEFHLEFQPAYWLDLINPRMLQSAKLTEVEGVPTILISKEHNEHIYNLLAARIERAANLKTD